MIIFDLDGTLADCEHRRHFVVKPCEKVSLENTLHPDPSPNWRPDWQSFYDACDKDILIQPSITIIKGLLGRDYYANDEDVHIWSGRCESVRSKTEKWLSDNYIYYNGLKMRPIGDSTPDDVLKERWLDELYEETKWGRKHPIEFVFDDRPKVIRMWRRRGIFVFNCCQHDDEF